MIDYLIKDSVIVNKDIMKIMNKYVNCVIIHV